MNENRINNRLQNRIDAFSSGRSMVEMLGVLAIVGVLSVGAIAGYSKAMFKHKLNRQAEQISTIFNNMLIEHDKLKRSFTSSQTQNNILPIILGLNIVYPEMLNQQHNKIVDIFKNTYNVSYGTDGVKRINYGLVFSNVKDYRFIEQCINVYTTLQKFSPNLWFIQSSRPAGGHLPRIYGDNYCTQTQPEYCLKNQQLSDMVQLCEDIRDTNPVGSTLSINWAL